MQNFISKNLNVKIKINYDISKPNGTPRKLMDTKFSKKIWLEIKIIFEGRYI